MAVIYGALAWNQAEMPYEPDRRASCQPFIKLFSIADSCKKITPDRNGLIDIPENRLIKIFSTIAFGDICWKGEIQLMPRHWSERSPDDLHITKKQKGLSFEEWDDMFLKELPAKLVRGNGTVIFGNLKYDAGRSTCSCIIGEYAQPIEDAQNSHYLNNGDRLTVFNRVAHGEIAWEGITKMTKCNSRKDYEVLPVNVIPEGIDDQLWERLVLSRAPIVVEL